LRCFSSRKKVEGDCVNIQKVTEPAKDIPLAGQYDVIVCGGGPAGIPAALAAARNGANVLLLEAHGCLGGVWTVGSLSWIIDSAGKTGIMQEIANRLYEQRKHSPKSGSDKRGSDSFA